MIKIVNDMEGYSKGIGDKFLVIFSPNLFLIFKKGSAKKRVGCTMMVPSKFHFTQATHSNNSGLAIRRAHLEIYCTISYLRHLVICYIDYALGTLRNIYTQQSKIFTANPAKGMGNRSRMKLLAYYTEYRIIQCCTSSWFWLQKLKIKIAQTF